MTQSIFLMPYLRWVFALILLALLAMIVLYFPWPSPKPLPFSNIQIEAGGGSREAFEEKIYSSSLSLATLKNYYNFQLWFFCNDWYWEVTLDKISTQCTFSNQTFSLSLKPQANEKVLVTQTDSWIEP
jgi:hypothetical protein